MLVLKALGGVALLGFLSTASAEQGAEPSASDSSPQTMNKVRVVDDGEPENQTSRSASC